MNPSGPIPVAPRRPRLGETRGVASGLALVVTLAAGGAGAATAPRATPQGPAVGGWASYRWTSTLTQTVPVVVQQTTAAGPGALSVVQEAAPLPPVIVTYSVVRGDRRTYTLQITTHEQPDSPPLSVTQVTVDRASGKARRSLIRYPKGLIATPESGLRPVRETDVAQGRPEEITVPAGRFTATRGAAQGAEVWASNQVPALGLVKATWREGTLELRTSGTTGATDLFKTASR